MDSGQRARWVSNASFATLTLIYSFTQMLDLASQFSTLAGVTFRVGQLLQVSPPLHLSSHMVRSKATILAVFSQFDAGGFLHLEFWHGSPAACCLTVISRAT